MKNIKEHTYSIFEYLKKNINIKNHSELLINIYHLCFHYDSDDINKIKEINTPEELKQLIYRSLSKKADEIIIYELSLDIIKAAYSNIHILKNIFQEVSELTIPSEELATALLNIYQKEHKEEINIPANLTKIITNLKICMEKKDCHTMCEGELVSSIALESSKHNATYLKSANILNKTIILGLAKIGGMDITPLTENKNIEFSNAYIFNAWNLPISSIANDHRIKRFPNVSSELKNIEEAIRNVRGRIIFITPPSWLYKSTGDDSKLKEYIITEGYLEGIIQLPNKSFGNTLIGASVIILNTSYAKSNRPVSFINATSDEFIKNISKNKVILKNGDKLIKALNDKENTPFSTIVEINEIIENDFNLSVKRYVLDEKTIEIEKFYKNYNNTVNLSEIANIQRCQSLKKQERNGILFHEISPSNINSKGVIEKDSIFKEISIAESALENAQKQLIETNDILFTIKGSMGKCALVTEEFKRYIGNQSFVIIRLNPRAPISAICLFTFLRSEICQTILYKYSAGASINILKIEDLKSFRIPIFSEKEQIKIENNYNEIAKLIEEKKAIETKIDELMSII